MRYTMLAIMMLTLGAVAPVSAETRQTNAAPTFDDCYRLAWVRGVHVERDELQSFDEECMANKIPFDSGSPSDSVRREPN